MIAKTQEIITKIKELNDAKEAEIMECELKKYNFIEKYDKKLKKLNKELETYKNEEDGKESASETFNIVDSLQQQRRIRREAMIEALRWADSVVEYDPGDIKIMINRLENGGEL